MTTLSLREIRLLIVVASTVDLEEVGITGASANEIKSVIYKAKSMVIDNHGIKMCESFSIRKGMDE